MRVVCLGVVERLIDTTCLALLSGLLVCCFLWMYFFVDSWQMCACFLLEGCACQHQAKKDPHKSLNSSSQFGFWCGQRLAGVFFLAQSEWNTLPAYQHWQNPAKRSQRKTHLLPHQPMQLRICQHWPYILAESISCNVGSWLVNGTSIMLIFSKFIQTPLFEKWYLYNANFFGALNF